MKHKDLEDVKKAFPAKVKMDNAGTTSFVKGMTALSKPIASNNQPQILTFLQIQ